MFYLENSILFGETCY